MILTLVYYKCPMLCTMVLNDLNASMGAMHMNVGEQFDILTVSFDPTETPDWPRRKSSSTCTTYRQAHAEEGWHFLTGSRFHQAADRNRRLSLRLGRQVQAICPRQRHHDPHAGRKGRRYFYGIDYSARICGCR